LHHGYDVNVNICVGYQELESSVGRMLTWYTKHQPCFLGVAWEWTDIMTQWVTHLFSVAMRIIELVDSIL